jgi:hypothetical protein
MHNAPIDESDDPWNLPLTIARLVRGSPCLAAGGAVSGRSRSPTKPAGFRNARMLQWTDYWTSPTTRSANFVATKLAGQSVL